MFLARDLELMIAAGSGSLRPSVKIFFGYFHRPTNFIVYFRQLGYKKFT